MITQRQHKILNALVQEYLDTAEPVSSHLLKEKCDFDCSPATIRNELQELTELGLVLQPHTSAGRVPTRKAYKYLADKIEAEQERQFDEFIVRQIKFAHQEMEKEMHKMEKLMQSLENDDLFEILNILDTWHKKII
jgi:heat-inducible transcriptional repressor